MELSTTTRPAFVSFRKARRAYYLAGKEVLAFDGTTYRKVRPPNTAIFLFDGEELDPIKGLEVGICAICFKSATGAPKTTHLKFSGSPPFGNKHFRRRWLILS